jgi:hypothetical protein
MIYVGQQSWKPKEDEMLRKLARAGETVANIAKLLDRKPESVRGRASRLKIPLAKSRKLKL